MSELVCTPLGSPESETLTGSVKHSRSKRECWPRIERGPTCSRLNGFTEPVNVSLSGLPRGVQPAHSSSSIHEPRRRRNSRRQPMPSRIAPVFAVIEVRAPRVKAKRWINQGVAIGGDLCAPAADAGLFTSICRLRAVTPRLTSVQGFKWNPESVGRRARQRGSTEKFAIQRRPDFDKKHQPGCAPAPSGGPSSAIPCASRRTLVENEEQDLIGAGNEGLIVLKAGRRRQTDRKTCLSAYWPMSP